MDEFAAGRLSIDKVAVVARYAPAHVEASVAELADVEASVAELAAVEASVAELAALRRTHRRNPRPRVGNLPRTRNDLDALGLTRVVSPKVSHYSTTI